MNAATILKVFSPPIVPSADDLRKILSRGVNDSVLIEMANADYGHDAEAHLLALRGIRDKGVIPAPMPWEPKEVLELIRWSEPDDPKRATGKRGHLKRAFACAILLRAAAEPANDGYFDGENQALVQLIASSIVLGREVQVATMQFIQWRMEQLTLDQERPFFAFGLFVLAVLCRDSPKAEVILGSLADWAVTEVERERETFETVLTRGRYLGGKWLLGLTCFTIKHETWKAMARLVLAEASKLRSADVRTKVTELASRVLGLPQTHP